MKQYCGRFPINKGLTEKLGYEDFIIYRDPEIGLYAYSEKYGLDVNLMTYNETIAKCTDDECAYWASLITDEICAMPGPQKGFKEEEVEDRYTLKYKEIDTRTNQVIEEEIFTDTLDGLMRDSKHRSMHTFQMLGQCTSNWYKSRGFENIGRDWKKWLKVVTDNIHIFVDILNEIEEENRNHYIEIGSNGTIVHTLCKYEILAKNV